MSLALVLLLTGCSADPQPPWRDDDPPRPGDSGQVEPGDSDSVGDSGDPQEAWIHVEPPTLNPANPFSLLVNLLSDREATVWVEYQIEGLEARSTPPREVGAGEGIELVVLGLVPQREVDLRLVAESGQDHVEQVLGTTESGSLPYGFEGCELVHQDPGLETSPDEIFCGNLWVDGDTKGQLCTDRQGLPVWWLEHPEIGGPSVIQPLRGGGLATVSFDRSELSIYDRGSRLQRSYPSSWFEGRTRFEHAFINGHDLQLIQAGPWAGALALLTYATDPGSGQEIPGTGIIVFDPATESVLWDWTIHGVTGDLVPIDGGDWYELDCIEQGKCLMANGLIHGLDADGEDRFWINLYHLNWIVQVNPDTDALDWRLGHGGDFALVSNPDAAQPEPLPDSAWMFNQHGPSYRLDPNGRPHFLLLDNGAPVPEDVEDRASADPYSRVVEYVLDEGSRRAGLVFRWGSDDPSEPNGFFSAVGGGAAYLPGGPDRLYLKGSHPSHFGQLDGLDGTERWRMTCPHPIYRGSRFDSVYEIGG